jgi:hypothetical protein
MEFAVSAHPCVATPAMKTMAFVMMLIVTMVMFYVIVA